MRTLSRILGAVVLAFALQPIIARAQEGVFLTEEQAPRAVFADADNFTRQIIPVSTQLRERMQAILGPTQPSMWEEQYVTFTARRGGEVVGHAVLVEEIGKHRPITFVVSVRPDGTVSDVAVVAYREAYGGEVRNRRFLKQYRGKNSESGLQTYDDIQNIAGATLSVDAANRAVKKALALAHVAFQPTGVIAAGGVP
jgi:Na+-translocating ferredoxin:NAD+ oxidoreductase RnfG subunit